MAAARFTTAWANLASLSGTRTAMEIFVLVLTTVRMCSLKVL